MAHRIVSDEVFLGTALDLFRTYGFEGVSLQQLADATGLEKASLYYRYPGGKNAIAMAIAAEVGTWFQANVLDPLAGNESPRKRVAFVAKKLREFYVGGTKSCVMEVLSIQGAPEELQRGIKAAMQALLVAFAQIAKESGHSPTAARSRAEEAVVRLEGSLVLARVMGDPACFERVLKALPDILLAAS